MSTRLRGNAPRHEGPYPLGAIPDNVIKSVGAKIVHRLAVGHADISGDDFGKIFADAVGGQHRASPLGIADVGFENCAWSAKTIKAPRPFTLPVARLISGRNSPAYGQGIHDPFEDVQRTGAAVLETWNARWNEARKEYDDLRIILLVRSIERLEFKITEYEAIRYQPANYRWELNSNQNFVARDSQGHHNFTWQSHGSQFTIMHRIQPSARSFRITRTPPVTDEKTILDSIGFDDSWIELVS